ncbi:hypothetical protein V6N13_148801 [Hibiscus sabdariffa]|uniref:Uncharacterized protein n=1 Tax=Hibiscus sabdariffa TaxID=183260 RepID=A0ABR2EJN3_9ROSI
MDLRSESGQEGLGESDDIFYDISMKMVVILDILGEMIYFVLGSQSEQQNYGGGAWVMGRISALPKVTGIFETRFLIGR